MSSAVKYVLFFISEENKYITLSSASTLFPKDVDFNKLPSMSKVKLTDKYMYIDFYGLFVGQSESKSEIDLK